ncbi:MBL fold metallo-hydrolase [Mycobacterium dioxanotrophicus]|uniref:MBL fold metallo-hydrolase n=1 Tax=Mycobacterium dioxanotrophicus TaxID=482462 RepID=A0A1Y0C257_9MYCO|nr:MBL fold metallo-hydrolase [Mycobacterium dioxanotrophicus]ART69261.1 MBL fold metallo-hydrolase [Mycobacterium dioxanotrophicus]
MKFIQYYLDCLSHASYLIGDETTGRAVVVDPQRDVAEYLTDADELGLRIELVIETHFHADFVSGHLELAEAAGATIVYSSVAAPEFDFMGVEDGQRISLGDVMLEFRHTPGHTPESMSIVVYERPGTAPYGVLTGDTLFIGDVGRPDLLASIGFTAEELAESLYASLHEQLMPLPDDTRVYPAHGAGSACGKNLSTDLWSTIGDQKRTNYALRAPDKQSFIDLVTEGQLPAPGYFVYDAILNRKDRALLDETELPPAMDYRQISEAVARGAMLIDGRSPEEFAQGHLRGAINIGLAGRYAEFAGSVVRPDTDIVLVTAPGQELEGKNRLARIGFDRVIGYLADPERTMFEHRDDVRVASRLTAVAFGQRAAAIEGLQIVDVRNPGEAAAGMIPDAVNIPVRQLPERVGELDANAPTVVYCAGGYRSSVAASLLRQRGFADVSDIVGGYTAWTNATQNA